MAIVPPHPNDTVGILMMFESPAMIFGLKQKTRLSKIYKHYYEKLTAEERVEYKRRLAAHRRMNKQVILFVMGFGLLVCLMVFVFCN